MANTTVSESNEIEYKTVKKRECAYVTASYFVREGKSFTRTYQEYILRKDGKGNWKILGYHQVKGVIDDE